MGDLGHKIKPFVYPDAVRRPDCPDTLLEQLLLNTLGYPASVATFMTGPLKDVANDPTLSLALPPDAFRQDQEMLWHPAKALVQSANRSIYNTLVIRLQMLQFLLAKLPADDVRNHRAIVLWQDAHLALVNYIEINEAYDDETLDSDAVAPYLPKLSLVFHEGELPAIDKSVMYCSFWGDNSHKFSIPIVHLFSKAIPHRCGIRGLMGIIKDKITSEPAILHTLTMLLAASMLGVYESRTRVRPDFGVRKQLYKFFFLGKDGECQEYLRHWMDKKTVLPGPPPKVIFEHEHTIFYVLKEALCFLVAQVPPLHAIICQHYPWTQFEQSVTDAMDRMRTMISVNAKTPGKDFFTGVEAFLTSYDGDHERNLYRPHRMPFIDAMVKATEDLETDELVGLLAPDLIPPAHKAALVALVAKYSPYRRIVPTVYDFQDATPAMIDAAVVEGLFPLACFGVSKGAIKALIETQERFEIDGSERGVKATLRKRVLDDASGAVIGERDYQIIRDFYAAVAAQRSIRTFTLPVHYFLAQTRALRSKHCVPNGEPSPPEMGKVLYCTCCRNFHGFLVKGKKTARRAASAVYAYGNDKVIVDDRTLKLYCGFRRGDRNDTKKRSSSKTAIAFPGAKKDAAKERRKAAKDAKKARTYAQCIDTELLEIDIVGKALQLGKQIIVLCTHCGNPTLFDQRKYFGDAFTCGLCDKNRNVHNRITCAYTPCSKELDASVPGLSHKVLNDIDHTRQGFVDIHLCPTHNRAWIRQCPTVLKLSEIFTGLENRWRVYQPQTRATHTDTGIVPSSQTGAYRRGNKHKITMQEKQ